MIIAFLYAFFKVFVNLLQFICELIVAAILLIIQFLWTFIVSFIRTLWQNRNKYKKKVTESKSENGEETPKGKYVILASFDGEWKPIAYFDTQEEAYMELKKRRMQYGAPSMIIQCCK